MCDLHHCHWRSKQVDSSARHPHLTQMSAAFSKCGAVEDISMSQTCQVRQAGSREVCGLLLAALPGLTPPSIIENEEKAKTSCVLCFSVLGSSPCNSMHPSGETDPSFHYHQKWEFTRSELDRASAKKWIVRIKGKNCKHSSKQQILDHWL